MENCALLTLIAALLIVAIAYTIHKIWEENDIIDCNLVLDESSIKMMRVHKSSCAIDVMSSLTYTDLSTRQDGVWHHFMSKRVLVGRISFRGEPKYRKDVTDIEYVPFDELFNITKETEGLIVIFLHSAQTVEV